MAFCLLQVHKTSLGEGIYGSPLFSEVSAFIQEKEGSGRLISALIDSHLPLAQNNSYTNLVYFGMAYFSPLYEQGKKYVQRQVIKLIWQNTACREVMGNKTGR